MRPRLGSRVAPHPTHSFARRQYERLLAELRASQMAMADNDDSVGVARPTAEIESGRRLALNGVMHDKTAGETRGHDRRKMQRGGGNYARRATASV